MDLTKVLSAVLVKALNMTSDEAAALLSNADATEADLIKTVLDKDKERVNRIKTEHHDNGHKKAKAEVLADFEKEIRKEFEVQDETLTGKPLIEHIIKTKSGSGQSAGVTEDAIKKHELYIKLQDDHKKALTDTVKEWKEKYANLEKSQQRASTETQIKELAITELKAMNAILPEDERVATQQIGWFVRDVLEGKDFEKRNDRWVVLKDGKVVEDDHGNAVELSNYIKSIANNSFAFKATNVGGNAGNKDERGSGGGGNDKFGGRAIPKTAEELTKIITDTTIPYEQRQAISDAYDAAQTPVE